MKNKLKYEPHIVEWVDANSMSGWHKVTEDLIPAPCVTLGFIINKNKERILLAMNIDTQNDTVSIGMLMAIPTPWITKIRKLK